MKMSTPMPFLLTCLLMPMISGCKVAPGKPTLTAVALRPEQVLDFKTLYKQNCSACHGENGRDGAAISLANPVYLETAGETTLQRITAEGVPQSLMPAFARSKGGMLTEQQVTLLAHGMIEVWGDSTALKGQQPPRYASSSPGDAAAGRITFATYCARCHGADGAGSSSKTPIQHPTEHLGSIVDPAYLALVSDQSLRSTIIAGRPDGHMPDWRSDAIAPSSNAMTDQEITDTVAWLASQRIVAPGQPYRQQQ